MEREQELVMAFHHKYGFPVNMLQHRALYNRELWLDVGLQRTRLMQSELNELIEAWHMKDIVKLADGLGDLAYTVLGSGVAAGITLGPVIREIHRSNMTKDVGNFKPVKGKDFQDPDLRPLLMAQGFKITEL